MTLDGYSGGAGKAQPDLRIAMIGPLPPPVDGQSIVMSHLSSRLSAHFRNLHLADTADRSTGWWRPLSKVTRSIAACRTVFGSDVVYVAVKADRGMWLTTATVGIARLARTKIFLHHHSYTYVRRRRTRMVALAKVAGKGARHIVLSQMMAKDLRATMPEIRQTLIIGNAALVDQSLLDLPLKADQDRIVLGHLSNLYLDKGIAEVVELAIRLHRAGCELRLIVGGPVAESAAQDHLERAASLLGHRFEYRGRLNGSEKHEFFNEITHFVFPSAYAHESVPLVLYEAMAAGVVCVATRRGSIAEQLSGSPGVLARSRETFVEDVLPVISKMAASSKSSMESRECYTRALAEANLSVEEFISVLRRGH